ncbi:MAG: ABC transporter ATP-binding protein [Clostridiales bacterium]|nr:ABC transporter ATP-binding protein [Clostridiales bacterium]
MLKGIDIRRSFGEHQVLNGINIDIPDQSLVMLCGRSGSGKTTLINILGGLDAPTSGEVIFEGQKFSETSAKELEKIRRYKMGFVFQSVALVPSMNAYENVDFALRIVNDRKDADARVKKALALVGLESRMTHMVPQLSGGEQQRVAIARALVHKPKLIFADEPTGALDTKSGLTVVRLFQELIAETGITIVMTTHDTGLMEMSDILYRIEDGRING